MAQAVGGGRVKLNNGSIVNAQNGGWYDAQQFWNDNLSTPGQFNAQNNQMGQQGGQAYVAPQDQAFVNTQRTQQNLPALSFTNPTPTNTPQTPVAPTANAGLNFQAPARPTIDLPGLYSKLQTNSGIDAITADLNQKDRQYLDAVSKINDNPYLSEATRVGRQAKLEQLHNERTANLRNQIAAKQAEVQLQLNLATQQYNIDDQNYSRNVSMYSNLLSSGAFNNANPQDIAQISLATGLSPSMVQSVITESKKSKEVKPQLITVDDGKNQKIVAVDQYGNKISEQILGASTKTSGTGASTNEGLATSDPQKLYDKYDTQIQSIIKEEDTASNKRDKGDKLLSKPEQEAALQRIIALMNVSREVAYDILSRGMSVGGYGNWTQ